MYGEDFQNSLLSPLVILCEKTMNNTSGTHLVNDMTTAIVWKELLTLEIKIYGRFECKFLNCLYVKDAKDVWKSLIWQANLKARSSTVRIADFNIYYYTFVLVAIFPSWRFDEEKIIIQQIIFMNNDDIICVTLLFGFFIFNTTDIKI